ncbi:MAG: hypothetical protein ACE5G8_02210, partial [Anaerolineae bacterium]
TSGSTGEREKKYFDSGANRLGDLIPGYNTGYHLSGGNAAFGTLNGIYGIHGNTNPPIPYNGMVYMHRGNSIIAFSPTAGTPTALPMAHTVAAQPAQITPLGATFLQTELETQIQKMLNAGHLRPAYQGHGIFNLRAQFQCGDDLVDYWHNTAETIYILSLALPHLPPTMQQELKTYIQNEFNSYPPYNYDHVGWRSGAAREIFDLPTDVQNDLTNNPPKQENYTFKNGGGWQNSGVWGRNPFGFYALWKYAEIFGNAQTIYNDSKTRLESPPADTVLLSMPLVHNAFIAGYLGYLELEKLAGQPETASVRSEYNRMLALRAANFTKDSAYGNMTSQSEGVYCRTLNIASNFMFMPPELAQYLRDNALSDVQAALTEYYDIAPYWFVTFSDEGFAENAINTLYDSHSLFMAKALILEEAPEELEKYLDVPGFDTGDLYYIQKLVTLLENQAYGFRVTPSPTAQTITAGGTATYTVQVQPTGGFTNSINLVAGTPSPSLTVTITPPTLTPPDGATLTVKDRHTGTGSVLAPGLWFSIPITVTGNGNVVTTSVGLLVGGSKVYLPLVLKNS